MVKPNLNHLYIYIGIYIRVGMAGRNRYDLAKSALTQYHGMTFPLSSLKKIIMRSLASSQKSIVEYCRLMEASGLTTEVEQGQYKVNTE